MDRLLKYKQPLSVKALPAGATVRNLQKKKYCAVGIPVPEEKQDQDKGKNIHQAPLRFHIREPGSKNSIREDFQKHYFGNTEGLEKLCRENLKLYVGKPGFCYTDNTNNTSNDELVEMFLDHGSYILGVLYKYGSSKANTSNGRVAQTLIDILENKIPFPVLFKLHKLKQSNGDDVSLLKALILLVKNCFEIQLRKLTQPLLPCKYKPGKLPEHLVEVVHSLCIPTNTTRSHEYDEECGLVLQQINTATELEKYGVSFQKIEEVQSSLFDIDFNWGMMKIRSFRIDDFTATFLRIMIAYEQHSYLASKYFTDFVLFMSHLIDTSEDAKLLCGKGIIANFKATDDKEKFFSQLLVGVNTSSTSTLSTLSGVINKVRLHCDTPLKKWMGMLRQILANSPWTPILGALAAFGILVGIVHYIKAMFGKSSLKDS